MYRKQTLPLVSCIILLFFLNTQAQIRQKRKISDNEQRQLRAAILKEENINKDNVLTGKLIYTSRKIDLNGDGQKEYLVWVPTIDLGGSGGYPIIVFALTKRGFRVLFEEGAWTPLIVMNSKKNGWRDIAFQTGGGGAAWEYNIIQFNGKSYDLWRTQKRPPKGQIIIGKDWKNTTFGPVTQN